MSDYVPCVIYAVKSSPDEQDSIGTQVEACRKAIAGESDRTVVGEPFTEDNASGSTANRGPRLAAAIDAAKDAARAHGRCELWVWHTSRLGRGTGRLGEARAVGALLYELRAAGVDVRSAEDDEFAKEEMLWGFASRQASKYTDDLKKWVRAGKERKRAEGVYAGGPPPDGYRQDRDSAGNYGPREVDEERARIVREAFDLARALGADSVARALNAKGYRRKSGKTWNRRSVQAMLANGHYAGLTPSGRTLKQKYGGGDVPALVEPETFEAVKAAQQQRDRAVAGRKRGHDNMPKGGRPTTRYVLAKLGRCGRCGGTMYVRTSPHKRKDGTRKRDYACANSPAFDRSGATCDQPRVSAEAADAAIVPHLRGFFVDFEAWLSRVNDAQTADRAAIENRLSDARARVMRLSRAIQPAHDNYVSALSEGRAATAEVALRALEKIEAEVKAGEAAVFDLEGTLSELDEGGAPTNAMLDWWERLSTSLRSALDDAETIEQVNGELRAVLDHVDMDTLPDGRVRLIAVFADRDEWWSAAGTGFEVSGAGPPLFPNSPAFEALPTLPVETGPDPQLYLWMKWKRRAFRLSQR